MEIVLSERLKKIRKELKISQQFVANHIGIHRTTVTAIESGARKVTTDELMKFAELYGVTLDELVYDEEIDDKTKKFAKIFSELSESDKEEIIDFIKFKKRIKTK